MANSLLDSASHKLKQEILSLEIGSCLLVIDAAVVSLVSRLLDSSQLTHLNIIGVEKL